MIIALSLPMVQRVEATGLAHGNAARVVVLVLFLVFFGWTGFYRLIRSQAMSMRERDFVMAAQAMGASSWRIIVKELLPNLWPTAIVSYHSHFLHILQLRRPSLSSALECKHRMPLSD
jgi:peptide/nickel transport system permease protein